MKPPRSYAAGQARVQNTKMWPAPNRLSLSRALFRVFRAFRGPIAIRPSGPVSFSFAISAFFAVELIFLSLIFLSAPFRLSVYSAYSAVPSPVLSAELLTMLLAEAVLV